MCSSKEDFFNNINNEMNCFDINVLANTICNTDNLIKQMRDIANENDLLKQKLKSINETAVNIKTLYEDEHNKLTKLEKEMVCLKIVNNEAIKNVEALRNENINLTQLQKQTLANLIEFEQLERASPRSNQLKIYRLFSELAKILKENDLLIGNVEKQFLSVIDMLPVSEIDLAWYDTKHLKSEKKKKITKKKTFCDQSTSYSSSNITRSTCTSAFIKKIDVGTNFPEDIPISIDSILNDTITHLPRLLTPIEDFKHITSSCSTQTNFIKKTKVCGTMTEMKNVRKKIIYHQKNISSSKTNNDSLKFQNMKIENVDEILKCSTKISFSHLSSLWTILGEAIFTIIGNGRLFESNVNSNVLNKLLELVSVIERETQTDACSIRNHQFITDILHEAVSRREELKKSEKVKKEFFESESVNEMVLEEVLNNSKDINKESNLFLPDNNRCLSPDFLGFGDYEIINRDTLKKPRKSRSSSPDFLGFDLNKTNLISETLFETSLIHLDNVEVTKPVKRKFAEIESKSIEDKLKEMQHKKILLSPISSPKTNKFSRKKLPIHPNIEYILKYYQMPELVEPIIEHEKLNELSYIEKNSSEDMDYIDKSPQSPISFTANEDDENIWQPIYIPLDRLDNNDKTMYSPQEPDISINNINIISKPINIPLNRHIKENFISNKIENNSAIDKVIANYDINKRNMVMKKTNQENETIDESRLIDRLRRIINHYLTEEWTSLNLKKCYLKILAYTKRPKIIIKCLIEIIRSSSDEEVCLEYTPPAPLLPKTHQKLLILIRKLTIHIKAFEKIFLYDLERKLFNFKTAGNIMLPDILSLNYIYIGLIDMNELNNWKPRMYMYKILYYSGFKSIPMIYSLLLAFPSVLPMNFNATEEMKSDPIVKTILTILMNTKTKSDKIIDKIDIMYRKTDLLKLLKRNYGYSRDNFLYEKLLIELIEKLKSNKTKNISYSLILLAKHQGFDWANKNIIKAHIIPMLKHFLQTINETDENNMKIVVCINTLSSIVKTCSNVDEATDYIQMMYTILQSSEKKIIQEASVMALLRLTRFGIIDIYHRISQWKPKYHLSRKTSIMLHSFVHRSPFNFWTKNIRTT